MDQIIKEGLELGDLKRLVHPSLHIDEYKSKMGDDDDICVVSFKIAGKEPALDLVGFIEKGYEWVLDADISSGEISDGDFLVFVEAERSHSLHRYIFKMMEDVMNLTGQELSEWEVQYPKTNSEKPLTAEVLKDMIPGSAAEYRKMVQELEADEKRLESMQHAAGIMIKHTAPVNALTDSLRIAAGLK